MAQHSVHVREAAKYLSKLRLSWNDPDWPTSFLIVHKEDPSLVGLIREVVQYLLQDTPAGEATVVWLSETLLEIQGDRILHGCPETVDLVVTVGGDGTVLGAAWLFQGVVPPIVSFHSGTVGFLNTFSLAQHPQVLDKIVAEGCRVNIRMRLSCEIRREKGPVTYHVLNELVVDRGASPMTTLDVFVDGTRMTTVQADGLIIATPTGSTAYSMAAGGSVIHPGVPSILITPICPHTLSFRPLLLPDSVELVIRVNEASRGSAWASFDGRARMELSRGDEIAVSSSNFPVPTVCREDQTRDWFNGLARCLHWNDRPSANHFGVEPL
jgi:NAD+ kinase